MMKNLISLLICCSFMIAVSTVVSYADNKVDFSGAYYLWAISETDRDHDSATDDDLSYLQQKLRVSVSYKANENVSAHMRADYSDGVWGQDYSTSPGWAEASEEQTIDLDRVYVTLKNGIVSVTAGQHWSGTANYILWEAQSTGVTVKLDLPMDIMLHYSKVDENGALTDDTGNEDTDFYATNFAYSSGGFGANLTIAALNDESVADRSPWAVGLQVTTKIGPVGLNVEVDQFGGSSGTRDVVGTQAYLDAGVTPSDALTFGLRLLYAMGTDDTANEVQFTEVAAAVESFIPFGLEGPMWGFPYPQSYPLPYKGQFDPAGASAGVIAFSPYVTFKATDNVTLRAKIGYLTPQEDANTTLDSIITGVAQVDWAMPMFPGATLSAAYVYDQPSYDDATADDTHSSLIGQLKVAF